MKKFIVMLQFLTRIPININLQVDEDDFSNGIIYFPVVGLVIGMFMVVFYHIGHILGGAFLAAVMTVIGGVFISGGLHLDGLGDTFDGVYSNRPKERILEIMKDSRLGTNAALAILSNILLKIALINSFSVPEVYAVILLMPVFSRLSIVYGARFSVYARKSGMGNLFIGKTNNKHLIVTVIITLIIALMNIRAIPFILVGLLFSLWYVRHISSKIDGMTGDTLGALCELTELVYLFYFAMI
ncbi:MAG: adenosylcobinamide-GDP ribazoletransferase [Marinisporobacter sp.]|jgi:adenosylcobinamide-GDP ribazoletransferase|nr:adenosylcobinamide-GDP ribazoletransferase [Marinisporobacter sp.]